MARSRRTSTPTERRLFNIQGLSVEVVRKDIKNLYVRVYPPDGRVRISAPLCLDDETVRLAVVSRLGWIRRQQDKCRQAGLHSRQELVTGEYHYYRGRRYPIDVIEHDGAATVRLRDNAVLELRVRPGADREEREEILGNWYRKRLRKRITALITKWEPKVGVSVAEWGVKKMKTQWGSCNPKARRIWLNLELAKKPEACLEYVLVHEMVHFLEHRHNERFRELMDQAMPDWRLHRDKLNRPPLPR